MSADYNIREKLHGAYGVDDKLLEALVAAAKTLTGNNVTVTFELQGDRTLESEDIGDLVSDSTLAISKVRGIQVRSSKYGEGRSSITIGLRARDYDAPVEMSLSGAKIRISEAIDECRNRIIGARTPYSFFYKIWNGNTKFVIALMLTLMLTFGFGYLLWRAEELDTKGSSDQIKITSMVLINFAISYYLLSLIDVFRNFFFPQLIFKFGKSYITYARRFKVLKFIFSGIIVAGVIGYLVNILPK